MNDFDAGPNESDDQFHQQGDILADHDFAGLHALNGRHQKLRQFDELTLVKAKQDPLLSTGSQQSLARFWRIAGSSKVQLCMLINDVIMSINDISDIDIE